MTTLWGREPAAIIAFVKTLLYVAVLFGAGLSEAQIIGLVAVVETGATLLTRSQVYAPDTVHEIVAEAQEQP